MDIFEKIGSCILEITGGSVIKKDQKIKEDIGLDSLSLVCVIADIEDEFNIEFNDDDLDPSSLIFVDDLVKLVEKYI